MVDSYCSEELWYKNDDNSEKMLNDNIRSEFLSIEGDYAIVIFQVGKSVKRIGLAHKAIFKDITDELFKNHGISTNHITIDTLVFNYPQIEIHCVNWENNNPRSTFFSVKWDEICKML